MGRKSGTCSLRVSEVTTRFVHIPRVLYHWREVEGAAAVAPDAKPYLWDLQLAVVRRHLERMGRTDAKSFLAMPGIIRVVWPIEPLTVSIIIPTKDKADILRRCLDSIAARTVYESYEIILVDTGSREKATHRYYASLERDPRIKIVHYSGAFNYSRACNMGAQHATGAYFLFMNNDMEVRDADWLEELVRWTQIPEIGVVGGLLLLPEGTVQHAG